MLRPPPGEWRLLGATLESVLATIYPEFRQQGFIVGGPAWLRETRFDLEGRMSPTAIQAEVQAMVRRLLDDRFGLRTHIEQRMMDVFVLTLARPGQFGPGLRRALSGCVTFRLANQPLPDECRIISDGFALPAHQISDLVSFVTLSTPGRRAVDRPIIDRTGLDGYFRMVIRYQPIGGTLLQQMQEQLGLKLTPAREAVDVLVIDSAAMPVVD
jgi:uncharacterized protein (TIGR03435 family)